MKTATFILKHYSAVLYNTYYDQVSITVLISLKSAFYLTGDTNSNIYISILLHLCELNTFNLWVNVKMIRSTLCPIISSTLNRFRLKKVIIKTIGWNGSDTFQPKWMSIWVLKYNENYVNQNKREHKIKLYLCRWRLLLCYIGFSLRLFPIVY